MITTCFKYDDNRPLPLYRTVTKSQTNTKILIAIQYPEPTHTVRLSSGLKQSKVDDERIPFDLQLSD